MRISVEGNAPLRGTYTPSENSNAAIGVIAASMLTDAPSLLHRLPSTLSIQKMVSIAQHLGLKWHEAESPIRLETPHIQTRTLEMALTSHFAPSVLFIAPMLARRQNATLEWDDSITRLYTHLTALRDLGLPVKVDGNRIEIAAERWESREIILIESSVTATTLVCMLAATLGQKTIIHNAASEPHVRIVQQQLTQMGARIEGIGSNLLTIYGTTSLQGATLTLPVDHIEIGSIAIIAALTRGQLSIQNVYLPDIRIILKVFERLGVHFFLENTQDDLYTLHLPEQELIRANPQADIAEVNVSTAPWPGYPSDLIAMTTVLATQIRSTTLIHEKLFPNRLLFTDKLKAMGAQIVLCDPHRAIVIGKNNLRGEYMDTPDVRTGLALLAAALCAEGQSIIDSAELINRTFENVVDKLTALGARIQFL